MLSSFLQKLSIFISTSKAEFFMMSLIFILPIHFITYLIKLNYQKKYNSLKSNTLSAEEIEKVSVDFFSKNQSIAIFRVVSYLIVLLLLAWIFNIQAFSTLAIAVGAFIVILKDPISSMISYGFLVSQYEIGNDIKINEILGEIVRIKLFYTGLAGKEENGDYNGKFIVIPNFLFFNSIVERQELKIDHYRRVVLTFLYKKEDYGKPFKEWMNNLKEKLDEMLPVRNIRKVGHYKSYAGVRYKLNYDYNKDGFVSIRIAFISKPGEAALHRKEEIIEYIESSKLSE